MATADYDVLVAGGGLAGLTAALQLKRMRPQTRVLVAERHEFPAPEAAYKVGESVAEIGAHYLKQVIGLEGHMETDQIRKFALRIFNSAAGNTDIARRPEIGLIRRTPLRTYQIDRGLLENTLFDTVADAGVEILTGHAVTSLELGADRHRVVIKRGAGTREVTARWLLDASGRAGLLRRKLSLSVDIDHDVNAAWFRVPQRLAVDEWSDDAAWHARVAGERWRSTCHLVGEGYWVWLIPLPTGPHSVGVVADPRYVPFERIRRYPALLEWARANEPELASKLPQEESGLLDFRKVKDYAYGTRRGLSPQRWCLTGEAGLFLDPLYATGVDFIAIANTLSTRLICAELDGEPDLKRRLKAYNAYYLGQFLGWQPAFARQYEVFRDPQATAAKVLWDNLLYFMFPVPVFNKGCMLDYEFTAQLREEFKAHFPLNVFMQRFFREWSAMGGDRAAAGFPIGEDAFMGSIFDFAAAPRSREEVLDFVRLSVRRLVAISHELVERMSDAAGTPMPEAPPGLPAPCVDAQMIEWVPYQERMAPERRKEPPAGAWILR